jgi:hypothetical protein
MIQIEFTPEDLDALYFELYHGFKKQFPLMRRGRWKVNSF